MFIHKKYTNNDDVSKYRIGDVIKFWKDNEEDAVYKMIACVERPYNCGEPKKNEPRQKYLLIILGGAGTGFTDSFFDDIPSMISAVTGEYKHYAKVDFDGIDNGRPAEWEMK